MCQLWFAGNLVTSKWSQFVFVIWMFTAYIVMQSYTANLSSNMTVSRLQHSTDKLYCIGFQDGSFVREILIKRLDFNVSRIKSYSSVEQYHDALSKGCHNGGVDAILDELPFIKIFLDKYGETNYKLLGSSYKTGGLGFVSYSLSKPLYSNFQIYISYCNKLSTLGILGLVLHFHLPLMEHLCRQIVLCCVACIKFMINNLINWNMKDMRHLHVHSITLKILEAKIVNYFNLIEL